VRYTAGLCLVVLYGDMAAPLRCIPSSLGYRDPTVSRQLFVTALTGSYSLPQASGQQEDIWVDRAPVSTADRAYNLQEIGEGRSEDYDALFKFLLLCKV
jgi:hypothetical protein